MSIRPLLLAMLLAAPLALLGANAAGPAPAPLDPLAGYPEGSYVMPDGEIAIPLRMPVDASYTPAVHEKVMLAAEKGMGYDYVNDREVAFASNFLFIRPGAWMWSPSGCTMNFIYGTPGAYKIGSAGHCNAVGQDVTIIAYPGVFANVGRTSASHNNGVGDDWSLVDIRSNMQQYVDANVAVIQGPQGGAFTGTAYVGLIGKHFGHGTAIGTGGTPRGGQVMFARDTAWGCVCVVVWGDSGSPILAVSDDYPLGQALGVVTHLTAGTSTAMGTLATAIPATVRNGDIDPRPPA